MAVIFGFTLLALRTARLRDNRSAAMAMVGLSACLVSPFTWYHHYVWTIPLSVVFFVSINQALGRRWTFPLGEQAAAAVSVLGLCAINFPFVAGPVWFGFSSGSLDAQINAQPFATLLWPATCVVAIVGYGLWGLFLRPQPQALEQSR